MKLLNLQQHLLMSSRKRIKIKKVELVYSTKTDQNDGKSIQ